LKKIEAKLFFTAIRQKVASRFEKLPKHTATRSSFFYNSLCTFYCNL